ncbi:TetR/AcrR family transcriptional regulator [Nonomuraea sp. NPDC049480]|uniref:TetR/AcrR family transcriptional regulator n=1 Tax=Nonomuraea sp. NPDC049480 TaxID=3364353 RepID=UPI0037AFB2AF
MPRPKMIDRTAILRTALEIADDDGVTGVSMHAVARRLGVTPMALYRHVGNKADLLDGIVERLLAEIMQGVPPPGETAGLQGPEGWVDALMAMARGARAVARRHPAAFALLLSRPAATAGARQVRAYVHDLLRRAGVGAEHVPRLERILTTAALGMAAGGASERFAHHPPGVLDDDFRALATFVTAGIEPFRSRPAAEPDDASDRGRDD